MASVQRHQAEGFYRWIEWKRRPGVLVRIQSNTVSFEAGCFDLEYDQRFDEFRQLFLTRRDCVQFMLNMGMPLRDIALAFSALDKRELVLRPRP